MARPPLCLLYFANPSISHVGIGSGFKSQRMVWVTVTSLALRTQGGEV